MHERKQRGRQRLRAGTIAIGLAAIGLACAPRALGPAFARAPEPTPERARLYVYRLDPRASISPVRLRIDGRPIGVLHHGEYETVELPTGMHQIEAGVRSVAFVAWGWNDLGLHIGPGETAWLKISVRLTERAQPAPRDLEIAGRTGGAVSENVYLQPMGEAEAIRELAGTTRLVPPKATGRAREP